MTLRWLVAALHLLALPLGLGGVWMRGRFLARAKVDDLASAFAADTAWGIAALIWISTGLWRAFGGLEKGSDYYLHSSPFHWKMGLLILILLLEVWPMITLIKWRVARVRRTTPDLTIAPTLALISYAQALLVVGMVLAATAMARGI